MSFQENILHVNDGLQREQNIGKFSGRICFRFAEEIKE